MYNMKSRPIWVWPLLILLLVLIASIGCHRAQDGPSHVARKAKAAHPPTASRPPHPPGDSTPSDPGSVTVGETNVGGASMTSGGGTGGSEGSGGGGAVNVHSEPPQGDGHPPTPSMVGTTSSSPAKKGARKLHHSDDSESASTDPDEALQNAVDSLPVGQVVFNHPSEMKMGEAKEVQVRISRDVAADISKGLTMPGLADRGQTTEHQQIKISTSMKVQLHGEPYFDVKPLTDEEQLIDKTGFTEWKFTVIPLQGGRWPLHLTVTAVVHAADREKVKNLEVLDEQVTVQVSTLEVVESFIGNNWQWLIGTVLIPVGAWLLPRLKKRKSQAQAA
jgi:hypothetical protein